MENNTSTAPKNAQASQTIVFDHSSFLKSVTTKPGIYQMYGADGNILYTGKAKNLKNRLSSYFRKQGLAIKTAALVSKIASIQVTITNTEIEALLLEHNLIKAQRPPYNILLRDDKSFPFIYLSTQHEFPRLSIHRGAKKTKGRYFGPYPSSGAVKESLSFLQKVFKVRQCEDSYYKNRSRPCLQHQINRCSAPCVNKVSADEYHRAVRHTTMFLEGKNKNLIKELADQMDSASADLNFETAAEYRDQIQHLQQVQASQFIDGESGDIDIAACEYKAGVACIQVLFVRGGRVLGSKSYFPKAYLDEDEEQILEAFLSQYYLVDSARGDNMPREIVVSHTLEHAELLSKAFTEKLGRKTTINARVRSNRAKWLALAVETAKQNLTGHLSNKQTIFQRYESLQEALKLPEKPKRLECFDISHSSGEATVASCVVFDANGPLKSDYRRFNIEGITGGDDYAAMHQALTRRYTRIKTGEGVLPDVLFIDGGKGQVSQAVAVLEELQITNLLVVGVAKGTTRKAGFEVLFRADTREEFVMPSDSAGLHLVQHIRDESHRFAITGHKQRRDKKRRESPLEGIPGVGPKRRRELLRHFGGWQEVKAASADDLANIPGISDKLARDIVAALHNG
ncbi:excinuclease ABC subunit C [marine gamma proteobacterium HTCC2143]|jgi:excinuclease ABC subunit C|uniref:UvrABC system protein C n=1 Tax=marine gamma proteobacterium HTCC2143 TaxID=247633 RepID=A0YH99_9GAMM|nr:excinuclease ABC subunit C [marine gamma proteobacterium HTCC2143]